MDELIVQIIANVPNFVGFVLLYLAMERNMKRCQETNKQLLDFLIETRGLDASEVRASLGH